MVASVPGVGALGAEEGGLLRGGVFEQSLRRRIDVTERLLRKSKATQSIVSAKISSLLPRQEASRATRRG